MISLQIGYNENVFYFLCVLHKSMSRIPFNYPSYIKNICLYSKKYQNTLFEALRVSLMKTRVVWTRPPCLMANNEVSEKLIVSIEANQEERLHGTK